MDVGRVELYPASVRQGDDPELVEGVTVTGAPGLTAVLGEVAGPVAETPRPYGVGPRAEAPEGPSLKTSTARLPPFLPPVCALPGPSFVSARAEQWWWPGSFGVKRLTQVNSRPSSNNPTILPLLPQVEALRAKL